MRRLSNQNEALHRIFKVFWFAAGLAVQESKYPPSDTEILASTGSAASARESIDI